MELAKEQKAALVPVSVGTFVFVVLDETIFRGPRGVRGPQYQGEACRSALRKSMIGGAVAATAAWMIHRGSDEKGRALVEDATLPAGAAAASFIAVNRVSSPFWSPSTDRRPFALAAAALAAWKTSRPPEVAAIVAGRDPYTDWTSPCSALKDARHCTPKTSLRKR